MALTLNEYSAAPSAVVVELSGEIRFVVEISGELAIENADEIQGKLINLAERGRRRLIVNLSGVRFVDAAGLGALCRVLRHVRRVGGDVDLVCVRPSTLKIFEIVGILNIFNIYNTVDDALAAHALEESVLRGIEASYGQADANVRHNDTSLLPITIYLSETDGHDQVQCAVENLLAEAGLRIDSREDPVVGSWFRRMWAAAGRAVTSSVAREGALVATHAIDTRLVLAHDAVITAKLMENLPPVIDTLKTYEEAVIRVGALLIVKADGKVAVHQLTPAQQAILDHQPQLAKSPCEILLSLDILAQNENGGNIASQQ